MRPVDCSLWEVGLNLLGVIPGGRLLTGIGRLAGLTRIGTRATTALSRGLAAGRASLQRMTAGLREGLGAIITRVGGRGPLADAGSLSLARPSASGTPYDFAGPVAGGGPESYNAVVRPGPLADPAQGYVGRQAGNFRNGSYTGEVLDDPLVVHRYSGGQVPAEGSYWTPGYPGGAEQAQFGNAINPGWGNTLTDVDVRVVPPGTTVYHGPAGPQTVTAGPPRPMDPTGAAPPTPAGGQLLGGDEQVFLPELPAEWGFRGR